MAPGTKYFVSDGWDANSAAVCVGWLQPHWIPRGQETQTKPDLFWLGELGTSKKEKKIIQPQSLSLAGWQAQQPLLRRCVLHVDVYTHRISARQNGSFDLLLLVYSFQGDF